jgi:hypothetical protein
MKGYEKEIIETVKNSFGIALNANDFFGYACADMVMIEYGDFHWAMPIIRKYGIDGEAAVMSKIADSLPIKPHITEKFKNALEEINSQNITVVSEY